MPTTLTGLLLFVVLLLPGFAYLVGKERHGTERHTSPFRETIAVVAASVTSESAVLAAFAVLRWLLPSWTPDAGALIHGGRAYAPAHYQSLAAWGFGMLAIATALAYFATVPRVRGWLRWLPIAGKYPHDSTVSGWWLLFEAWPGEREVELICTLDDGSAVRGFFQSFNTSADDSPDRDLILRRPIRFRPTAESQFIDFDTRYVCLSARRIVSLFVSYPPQAQGAAAQAEGQAVEAQALPSPAPEDPSSGDLAAVTHPLAASGS
jgi:hypothetical protein